ncbi:MAG: hypothetical protein ACOYEC_05165 [Christensenellales bacterium]|jgi:hypothetical protein|nr:hypothetical protein [Clostridiales bacterium]
MFRGDGLLPILILLLCGCCDDSDSSPFGGRRRGCGCGEDKATTLAMCLSILLLCCGRDDDCGDFN